MTGPSPSFRLWCCVPAFPSVSLKRRFGLPLSLKDDALITGVDDHRVPRTKAAPKELIRQLILDQPLDRPPQRPRAERGIEPFLGQQILRRLGQLQLHVLPPQLTLDAGDEDIRDRLDLVAGQG